LDQYRALLEEHLAHWPAAETADQARLWRGRLHEAEGNWEDALHDYEAIKPTSAQSVTRYDRLRGIYEKVLVGSDAETTARLKEARQWLDAQAQSALAGEGNLPAARALLEAARLRLFHDPTDYPAADVNLEEALSLIDRASPQAQELRALAVVAAAGRNQMQRAHDEHSKAVPLPARPLVDMLRGLQRVLDGRPNDGRLVDLMAKTAKLLTVYRDQLSETDRRLLAETEADTLQRSNLGDATKIYTQLAEGHPRNARIQRRLAELLSLGKDRRARQAALTQWRLVVRKSRPYTQAWFRGKLGVATAHFDLNDRKHAQDMIELLMSLHPKMGGPELKRDFTSLLQRCRQ
jgi:tetratricopeptide (TPR) repeat protein